MKEIKKGAQKARVTSSDCIHLSFGINNAFTADKVPPLGEHITNCATMATPTDTEITVLVFAAILFSS